MIAATAAACSPPVSTPEAPMERSEANLRQIPVEVETATGRKRFIVEVAETRQEQATGLMNRPVLAPDHGMLFPYDPPEMASFWMKNTLIPLDIIFIRPDGSIIRVADNAEPLSLTPIPSFEPVSAVLEIAGGRAAELGIGANDRVSWPR